jgi:hypothetical protein
MKKISYLLLFVLPLLLVITAASLNKARGPYWLGGNLDPEYVYLLNSANFAGLKGAGHIDHPGTPVQVIGAVTMRAVHFFNFSSRVDLHTDVSERPEYYLNAINIVFIAMNAIILCVLGIVTFLLTQSIFAGLWLQLAPFFSITILQSGLTRVSPEPLLLFTTLAVVTLVVVSAQRDVRPVRFALALGFVIGFGIAAKITFFPIAVLLLIALPRIKYKLLGVATAVLSFVIFTLPIIRMYRVFFDWIYKLLVHSGHYGTGPSRFISINKYIKNLHALIKDNPFFSIVLILSLVILAAAFLLPGLRKISLSNRHFRLLAGAAAAQAVGLIMVSKHSANHYLLPELCLTGLTLFLIYYYLKHILTHYKINMNYLKIPITALLVFVFIFTNPSGQINTKVSRLKSLKKRSIALYEHMQQNYKDYAQIYYYRSSSPAYALKFGSDLSRSYYAESLQKLYPNVYFYDNWRRKFYRFDYREVIPFETIRAAHGDKIVFQGPKWVKMPGVKLNAAFKTGTSEVISLPAPPKTENKKEE